MKVVDVFGNDVTIELPSGRRTIIGCYNKAAVAAVFGFLERFGTMVIRPEFNGEVLDNAICDCVGVLKRGVDYRIPQMIEDLLETPSDQLLDKWPMNYLKMGDVVTLERMLLCK